MSSKPKSKISTTKVAHTIDSISSNKIKESKVITKTNQFYQKKSIESHIKKIFQIANSKKKTTNENFNVSKEKSKLNLVIGPLSKKSIENCNNRTNNLQNENLNEEIEEHKQSDQNKLENISEAILSLKNKKPNLLIKSDEDLQFHNEKTDKEKGKLSNQITPVSKKNKLYKSLKPLGQQFNRTVNSIHAINSQVNNTRNTIKDSSVPCNLFLNKTKTTENNINNNNSEFSSKVSPQNKTDSSNSNIKNKFKKLVPKSLNYSTINTSTSNSVSCNSKPKTPSSYHSKLNQKFLINKIKQPVSTKNSDAQPFRMMFSSFEISKEAMSFEEVGDDSYDYFKKFYSQVFNEKQNEAESSSKPVTEDKIKSDEVDEAVIKLKSTKSKFQNRNVSLNSAQRFSSNYTYKSSNDIKSIDKLDTTSNKKSLEHKRFDSQANKEVSKEITTIKVRANSKINKNKAIKQNDVSNKSSQAKKLINVSKGVTEKTSIYKNAKIVKPTNSLK